MKTSYKLCVTAILYYVRRQITGDIFTDFSTQL